jgi:hypothetical protein
MYKFSYIYYISKAFQNQYGRIVANNDISPAAAGSFVKTDRRAEKSKKAAPWCCQSAYG